MNEQELARTLLTVPVPGELDAQQRAWAVVRAAYAEREHGRRGRRLRPLLAFAVVLALVGAAALLADERLEVLWRRGRPALGR